MNFNLEKSTMFLTLHGSHAYGLNTPESDYDFRGVACPPVKIFTSPFSNFEQSQGAHDFVEDIAKKHLPNYGPSDDVDDCTIFSIQKFVKLASDCNPNIIELLFMPQRCVLKSSRAWEHLESFKDDFVSLKAKFTFSGYAFAQLKRIKNHKKWVDAKPVKPNREDFGLPREKLGGTEFINSVLHIQNDKSVKLGDEFVERARNEKKYNEAMRVWKSYGSPMKLG